VSVDLSVCVCVSVSVCLSVLCTVCSAALGVDVHWHLVQRHDTCHPRYVSLYMVAGLFVSLYFCAELFIIAVPSTWMIS